MTESKDVEEVGSLSKPKKPLEPWEGDCYGYAAWRATNDHFNETLTWLPDDEFETGSISDNCIVEWDNHAAYVKFINTYTMQVTVDEYVLGEVQHNNVHPIGGQHSILGDDWVRWVREIPDPPPPDPVSVEIDGPTHLDWDEEGEFEAIAQDGYTPYSNYMWWWRLPALKKMGGEEGDGILGPPPGEWQYLSSKEGDSVIEWGYEETFELKCRVYDKYDNTAEDIHQVIVD